MNRKEMLLQFLQADPEDSFSRYALGLEYLAEGDAATAADVFAEVRQRQPGYVATYYQLGKAFELQGDAMKAREAWTAGLEVAAQAKDWHTHDELTTALDGLA